MNSLTIFRTALTKFIVFTDEQWEIFIQHLTFVSIKKKRHFTIDGKVCDHIGFIVSGSMRYYHIKDGVDITNYFSFEKELVSSYKSFLTRTPGSNYIQALEDTEMILISHDNLQAMLDIPLLAYSMERFGRLVAEYYLICYEERMVSFIIESPEERYIKMLETDREVWQRIPQHYIANFLGITPVSLSRIRKRVLVGELAYRN